MRQSHRVASTEVFLCSLEIAILERFAEAVDLHLILGVGRKEHDLSSRELRRVGLPRDLLNPSRQ